MQPIQQMSPERIASLRPFAARMLQDVRNRQRLWTVITETSDLELTEVDREIYRIATIYASRLLFIRLHAGLIDPKVRRRELSVFVSILLIFVSTMSVLTAMSWDQISPIGHTGLFVLLMGDSLLLGVLLIPITRFFRNREYGMLTYAYLLLKGHRRTPDLLLIDELQRLLNMLQRPLVLTNPSTRRFLGRGFKTCAGLIEVRIPRLFAVAEVHADHLLKQRCVRAASYLREFSSWVAVPHGKTREDLIREVSRILVIMMRCELDRLPSKEPVERRRNVHRLTSGMVAILRHAFIAIAPFAFAVWVLPQFAVVPNTVDSWLRVLTAIWMVISIVIPLDPFFASKIAALKDISATLRSNGAKETAT